MPESLGRKILITTAFRKGGYKDYFTDDTKKGILKYSWPMKISFGLRFIKHNIPQIEILEYPTWNEFQERLKEGWDVVGFSFYIRESPDILKMIDCTRKAGVKEIWGGNYGALTSDLEKHFDRIFVGYAEKEMARELGIELREIKHPTLVTHISLLGLKLVAIGVMFTSRGCSFNCDFCQSPKFSSKCISKISIKNLENLLVKYKKMGISDVFILDESFGADEAHSERVTNLLKKNEFHWTAMTRTGILNKRLDQWKSKGMAGVVIGIESLNQNKLNSVNKGTNSENTVELLKKLKENGTFVLGFYIIGFENDTVDSIKRDIKNLKKMKIDMSRIYIMTPLPGTGFMGKIINKYGIFDKNYLHYDGRNLVWNHPNISADEMIELQKWSFRKLQTKKIFFRTSIKFLKTYLKNKSICSGIFYLMKKIVVANKKKHL